MNPNNTNNHSMRQPGSLARLNRSCSSSLARALMALGLLAGSHAGVRAQVDVINMPFEPVPIGLSCVSVLPFGGASNRITLHPGSSYIFTFETSVTGATPSCLAFNPPIINFSLGINFGNLSIMAIQAAPGASLYFAQATIPAGACGETAVSFTCDNNSIRETTFLGLPWRLAASATDDCSSVRSCSADTPPTISCPPNIVTNTEPGQCSALVTYSDPIVTGSPAPTVTCTPASGSFTTGTTTVTCTAVNSAGTANCSFTIIVVDAEPPSIICAPPSIASAGANCQAAVPDVTGLSTAADNCGPAGLIISQSPLAGTPVELGPTPITVTVTDAAGNTGQCTTTFTVVNAAPVITSVTGPSGPLALGTSTSVTVQFADADVNQAHTCMFDWDDGSSDEVAVGAGAGTATTTHTYAAPGVYSVTVTVADPCTSMSQVYEFIVIYDPEGGFVTGGGCITSPPGAFPADPTATGKADFGFVSKYKQGANVPTGETEFQFEAAGMLFQSTSYQWLVVAGTRTQYKGVGTINGAGNYDFLLTAVDGHLPGGGGVDKFRIKITDAGVVVYDNGLGASDDIDTANPLAITAGSIVIHK